MSGRLARSGRIPSPNGVINLAQKLHVHPAIVAGRVRHDRDNYRLLSQFVGAGEVRRQFEACRGYGRMSDITMHFRHVHLRMVNAEERKGT